MALAKAEIENLYNNKVIPVMFNPNEYKINKQVNYGNIDVQSIESKMLTYQNGEPKTLDVDLFFDVDTGDESTMESYEVGVRGYTDEIMKLTSCVGNGCPPLCRFKWGNLIFTGYVTSVQESFTRFNSQGVPIRAIATLSMKENYVTTKSGIGNLVDTLEDLYSVLENSLDWRSAAQILNIINPRKLD